MRFLIFALLFASFLLFATNTLIEESNNYVYGSPDSARVIVEKVVEGPLPESDWEFIGGLGAFTIDKAGGITTFTIDCPTILSVTEVTKSGYVVYCKGGIIHVSYQYTSTHVVEIPVISPIGVGVHAIVYSNRFEPHYPVGGILTPTNKPTVLTTYLILISFVAFLSSVYIIKRRRNS